MKKKTSVIWAAGIAAGLAAGLAAGVMSGASAAENARAEMQVRDGFLNAEQTLAEFKNIGQTDLKLPDGISWPTTPPAELSDTEAAFEDGFIETTAHLYWLCSWEDALVNAPAARGGAGPVEEIAGVQDFAETQWFKDNYVDPLGAWEKAVVEPALAGDLSGVQQDLDSCGYFYANQ